MKLGIMQPYFFPNLSHFALIKHVDHWVIFDGVQFIRHGWIERNRILKPDSGYQYIAVPLVKHTRDTLIRNVLIRNSENWKQKIKSQLGHYKKRAPHYSKVLAFLDDCFEFETDSIVQLNAHLLKKTMDYLELPFEFSIYSELELNHENVTAPGDWALEISKNLKASHYVNPIGGKELFDKQKYADNNIQLNFLALENTEYVQKGNDFESHLSIIDVMMFNSPEEIREMLSKIELS